jgi:putative PIN family toxin of toxin-antitoxin system
MGRLVSSGGAPELIRCAALPNLIVDSSFGIIYTTTVIPNVVIDTNVFIAALRSKRGASYLLLSLLDSGKFVMHISVPLILEYEDVALRQLNNLTLNEQDIKDILDYICKVAVHRPIFYLWRPVLKDPKDDMVLELAVAAECQYIVTFNVRDFIGSEQFGIHVVPPKVFLQHIGVLA